MPKKRHPTDRNAAAKVEATDLVQEYKITLGILDSAISAALLAGLQPYPFEAPTAFWFIQSVGYARTESRKDMEVWRTTMFKTFDAIVERVQEFAFGYAGELLPDGGEEGQFRQLETPAAKIALSELELKRQQSTAKKIVDMCMDNMKKHNIDPRVMELAFLLTWLKVAALAGDIPEKVYFTVLRSVPFVVQSYGDIADAGFN